MKDLTVSPEAQLRKAKYEGTLKLGQTDLTVAVLEDGTRLISRNAIFKAFERTKRGRAKDETRVANRPSFIDANNLQAFINPDIEYLFNTIEYEEKNGKLSTGYNALILPQLCKIYMDARSTVNPDTKRPYITKSQEPLALVSEKLLFALSTVGIIALIDEATGYQYDREKYELQTILQAFISDEILEWQKTFQLSFYKEIFRLWDIPFTAENIKRKPRFVGKLTSDLVYKNMPKGIFVLEKLKAKTPKSEAGNYKYRLHQSLTADAGREALKKVIYSIEALASISDTRQKFKRLVQEKYGQTSLPFDNADELDKPRKKLENTQFNNELKGLLAVPKPISKDKKSVK